MEKIVGFDIGESSVKLVYFAGADLKKAAERYGGMINDSWLDRRNNKTYKS